jgi:hypothetical protein
VSGIFVREEEEQQTLLLLLLLLLQLQQKLQEEKPLHHLLLLLLSAQCAALASLLRQQIASSQNVLSTDLLETLRLDKGLVIAVEGVQFITAWDSEKKKKSYKKTEAFYGKRLWQTIRSYSLVRFWTRIPCINGLKKSRARPTLSRRLRTTSVRKRSSMMRSMPRHRPFGWTNEHSFDSKKAMQAVAVSCL